jgi:uncharacterized protein
LFVRPEFETPTSCVQGYIVTSPSHSRAIDPALFTWPSVTPALLGSRCTLCGFHAFPAIANCARCGATSTDTVELPRRGKLWAWTIQRFMPKTPYHSSETPQTFRPYGVGYVELPGALRVETRLTENDPAKLHTGQDMELVIYVHRTDPDGTEIMNYAFRPASSE